MTSAARQVDAAKPQEKLDKSPTAAACTSCPSNSGGLQKPLSDLCI